MAARLFSKATPKRSGTIESMTTVWSQPSRKTTLEFDGDMETVPTIPDEEDDDPSTVNWSAVDSLLTRHRLARDRHSLPSTKEDRSLRLTSESIGTIADEADQAEVLVETESPIEGSSQGGSHEMRRVWRKWEEEDRHLTVATAEAEALRRHQQEQAAQEQLWTTVQGLLSSRHPRPSEGASRSYSLTSDSTAS